MITIRALLVESFFKEDNTTEARKSSRSSEEKLTKSTSVRFNILNIDASETFPNGTSWFICRKDTFPRCADVSSVSNQLICESETQQIQSNQSRNKYFVYSDRLNELEQVEDYEHKSKLNQIYEKLNYE